MGRDSVRFSSSLSSEAPYTDKSVPPKAPSRTGTVLLSLMGFIAAGIACLQLLSARRVWSNYVYQSRVYWDVSGAAIAVLHAVIIFFAGGMIGFRLTRLLFGWRRTRMGRPLPGDRLGRGDWWLAAPMLIVLYLTHLANCR